MTKPYKHALTRLSEINIFQLAVISISFTSELQTAVAVVKVSTVGGRNMFLIVSNFLLIWSVSLIFINGCILKVCSCNKRFCDVRRDDDSGII